MTGGLLQIVSYGSQDLYLTGVPEITFFKVVYRRYTNFAMESHKVYFDDTVGFGQTSSVIIPSIGDLISKMYIEIKIPTMDLKRNDTSNDNFPAYDQARNDYETVRDFMSINRRAYVGAYDVYIADNSTNTQDMINAVDSVFNDIANESKIQDFKDLLLSTELDLLFTYEEISMQEIVDQVPSDESKEVYISAMNVGLYKSTKTQEMFFNDMIEKRDANDDENNSNLKFAWTDRLGHAIIEEVEIRIGGYKIDHHLGEWINIWYELTANRDMQDAYYKMIGNVPELTNFNRDPKPQYTLRIPMQFWFCRHNGLAIPLIALEYHDVSIHVKFRNIEDVCYIEENKTIYISDTQDNIYLDEVVSELGIDIEANLAIDYIYLDQLERKKFAQSSHEYLIDQVQFQEYRDIQKSELQCILNNFVHPSKEIIWVAQKEKYTQNISGYIRTRWDNYSISDENKGNIVTYSSMFFHSYNRVIRLPSIYYNYVQPREVHNTTPSDGINMYSFCLSPELYQPSGSANMSRLSRIMLDMEFDPSLVPEEGNPEPINVRIYTRSTNILRFVNGMGGTGYTYG